MSLNSPLVSIIIPSYNQLEGLRRSLDFLKSHELRGKYEVLVIDGGSNDGSVGEVLRRSGEIEHIITEPDQGIYDAMNKGIALANGTWCWFLGTGDIPNTEGFNYALKVLTSSSTKGLSDSIHGFSVRLLPPLEPGVPEIYTPDWSSKLKWRNTMHHQGVFYPTSVINDLKYDLRFRVLADYHLNLKLWVTGCDCLSFDKVVAHVDAGGVSRNFNSALYKEERMMKDDLGLGGGQGVWTRLKHLWKSLNKAIKP